MMNGVNSARMRNKSNFVQFRTEILNIWSNLTKPGGDINKSIVTYGGLHTSLFITHEASRKKNKLEGTVKI